jgi:predicted flavoprotein YhiN
MLLPLRKNFDKRVDITIDENADNYSSEQAEMILKSFLSKYSKQRFFQWYTKESLKMVHNMLSAV